MTYCVMGGCVLGRGHYGPHKMESEQTLYEFAESLTNFGGKYAELAPALKDLSSKLNDLGKTIELTLAHNTQLQSRLDLERQAYNDLARLRTEAESRLGAALKFVSYIAKRYEEGWDEPVTERFYNEAKALLGETAVEIPKDQREALERELLANSESVESLFKRGVVETHAPKYTPSENSCSSYAILGDGRLIACPLDRGHAGDCQLVERQTPIGGGFEPVKLADLPAMLDDMRKRLPQPHKFKRLQSGDPNYCATCGNWPNHEIHQ